MFQLAAPRNATSWGGNGPRLRRWKPGEVREGGRLAGGSPLATAGFWRIDGSFRHQKFSAIWPKPLCTSRTSGLVFSLRRPQPWLALRFILHEPVLGLARWPGSPSSVRRALTKNRPMLRYLRVEELAAFTRARRSAYCARGSLQLEGVDDPTMPRLWRQQPCPCQTPV